jgi:pantoate--beta-alanine ligase
MCGISRPTHFRGVTTIVAKLFNIIKPHVAIFGEKDFQQAIIIKRMVKDLNYDIAIETGPIVREADGLALSSRNNYLNATDRKNSVGLYNSLKYAQKLYREGEKEAAILKQKMEEMIFKIPGAKIDYIEIIDPDTLESLEKIRDRAVVALAVFLGGTRLIDNVKIHT